MEWTLLIGLIALAVTTIGVISTILTIKKPLPKIVLFSLLGFVGVFGLGAVLIGIAMTIQGIPPSPTPTPAPGSTLVNTPVPTPSAQPSNRIPTPNPTATAIAVTPTPVEDRPVKPDRSNSPPPENTAPRESYRPGDIGISKTNGYYELTLENATVSYNSRNCSVKVSNDQKMVAVKFSIRAVNLEVPDIAWGREANAYYILDPEQRRSEFVCGDGRYFNASLNSFEGKPLAKTLIIEFVVPRNSGQLMFRFSPQAGNAIMFKLPNSI